MYSELLNKRADQNKRVWREHFFFHLIHEKRKYGGIFPHLLVHEKLKVCRQKIPKHGFSSFYQGVQIMYCKYVLQCLATTFWFFFYESTFLQTHISKAKFQGNVSGPAELQSPQILFWNRSNGILFPKLFWPSL